MEARPLRHLANGFGGIRGFDGDEHDIDIACGVSIGRGAHRHPLSTNSREATT